MRKNKIGKLITHNIKIESHEMETALYFVLHGEDVELLPPSNTPHNKNADFMKNGIIWEGKRPVGKSLSAIEHLFRKAVHQSENVVFDLRRFRGDEKSAVIFLKKKFKFSRSIKKMQIIQKNEELLKLG